MRIRLTDARIAALRPREREVWDATGLGVRVRPSGHRGYLRGGRKASLGPATLKSIDEARRECLGLAAEKPTGEVRVPTFAEFVAGPWKEACWERYKRASRRGIESVLNRQLLPAFSARPLDRIAAVEVNRWFDRYSRTAPAGPTKP